MMMNYLIAGVVITLAAHVLAGQMAAGTHGESVGREAAAQRVLEKLDRGMIALRTGRSSVYVGWRLLDDDPAEVGFHVYRRHGQAEAQRLTAEPVRATADFVDDSAPAGVVGYFVRPVVAGQEGPASAAVSAPEQIKPYRSIRLRGDYGFQKVAVADLTGDGRYDFVIKTPNSSIDPWHRYWSRSEGTYTLEAYDHDGRFMWEFDLGWSIERGIWYSPYVVHDLTGNGHAEVILKTGEGDPRDEDGKVTSGPEYLTVLDGRTGQVRAQAPWPERFEEYNRYSRNQLAIAYLDGRMPCIIVNRGTYNHMVVEAWTFDGQQLRRLWSWTPQQEQDRPGRWNGQGSHSLIAVDVNDDGRDEIVVGSVVLSPEGNGLWTTSLGHPDQVSVGKLDPDRPGLQIAYGIETRQPRNGICMVDAATGEIIWGLDVPTRHIHSKGLTANIDPRYPGSEVYGGEQDDPNARWLFSSRGELIADGSDLPEFSQPRGLAPYAAYWDADLHREVFLPFRSGRWPGAVLDVNQRRVVEIPGGFRLFKFPDRTVVGPAIEGNIRAVADIQGDWREEIITSVDGELRIYSTTIPAADRRVTLVRDPVYRAHLAVMSQGYLMTPSFLNPPGE